MREKIEQRLDELIPNESSSLIQAARYAVLGGGKRLRPQMVLTAAKMLGASEESSLDPACAIEMIHAYSLIHDDLPCMDNDAVRHGKPSLHIAFAESTALLAGDFLLTYAFEILANAPHLNDSQRLQLVKILSKRAGKEGMIGGQVLDMESGSKEIDLEKIYAIHRGKTAALFTACLEFAEVIALKECSAFKAIGQNLGLAYQILDDLHDASSKTQEPNIVTLLGRMKAAAKLEELKEFCFSQIKSLPDSEELTALTQKLLIRNY